MLKNIGLIICLTGCVNMAFAQEYAFVSEAPDKQLGEIRVQYEVGEYSKALQSLTILRAEKAYCYFKQYDDVKYNDVKFEYCEKIQEVKREGPFSEDTGYKVEGKTNDFSFTVVFDPDLEKTILVYKVIDLDQSQFQLSPAPITVELREVSFEDKLQDPTEYFGNSAPSDFDF